MLLSLVSSQITLAQDVIVKKDGSTVLSKVMEIGSTEIKYKKWSNQDGPLYTISVSELQSINYENGERETFDAAPAQTSTSQNPQQPQAKSLGPDARNAELIQLYNKDYNLTEYEKKRGKGDKIAKAGVLFFKVEESSVMSNEELEMSFITCTTPTLSTDPEYNGYYPHMRYNIVLKNKTNQIIYIDLASCIRSSNLGEHRVYFTSEEVGVGQSSGGGVSVGLGAVAGALGIGGVVGAVANGIGIGQGNSTTVNKSYTQQRILSIPPRSTAHLTDFKYLEVKKDQVYTLAEKAEEFSFDIFWPFYARDAYGLENIKGMSIRRGFVNQGQEKVFTPDNSPLVFNYVITYSTTNDFSTYSTLNSTLYASKVIGMSFHTFTPGTFGGGNGLGMDRMWKMWRSDEGMEKYIENYNHHTICGPIEFL